MVSEISAFHGQTDNRTDGHVSEITAFIRETDMDRSKKTDRRTWLRDLSVHPERSQRSYGQTDRRTWLDRSQRSSGRMNMARSDRQADMARSNRRTWLDRHTSDPDQKYTSNPDQEYSSHADQEYKYFMGSETHMLHNSRRI